MSWKQVTHHLLTNPLAVAIGIDWMRRVVFLIGRFLLPTKDLVTARVTHCRANALTGQRQVLRADAIHAHRQLRLLGAEVNIGQGRAMHHQIRTQLVKPVEDWLKRSDVQVINICADRVVSARSESLLYQLSDVAVRASYQYFQKGSQPV